VIFVFKPSEKTDDVDSELDKSPIPVQNFESPIKPHSSIAKSSPTVPLRLPAEHRILSHSRSEYLCPRPYSVRYLLHNLKSPFPQKPSSQYKKPRNSIRERSVSKTKGLYTPRSIKRTMHLCKQASKLCDTRTITKNNQFSLRLC
jgi:hypothetical protein